MSETMNGVITTATGNLDRSGYCDFENDGSFNGGTETYKTNIPKGMTSYINGTTFPYSKWNGSSWDEITE